ncbi:hypothetical protein N0V88_001256 [Collariella sp. IMI 366227]|nr:hypothetical protein N0V88_001256 [Collariella sp. IMI 366227]
MNAQVSFLDGTLSLIHIPLDLYSILLQPILKVLLPPSQGFVNESAADGDAGLTTTDSHGGFLNISVTPIECSIVCNSTWATSVFEPAIKRLPKDQAKMVAISKETYAVLSVYGQSMDAGSRVADLTSPLALANIPIFFITTYYSDFILVPTKDRQAVVKTLLVRGFVFSEDDQSSLVSANPSPRAKPPYSFSLTRGGHSRTTSQDRTTNPTHPSPFSPHHGLVSQPRFLSLTLAHEDPPSLLLDKQLLPLFGDALIGATEGGAGLVPIFWIWRTCRLRRRNCFGRGREVGEGSAEDGGG